MLLLIQRLGLLGQMDVLPAEELDCADHVQRVVLGLALHRPQLLVQLEDHCVLLESSVMTGEGWVGGVFWVESEDDESSLVMHFVATEPIASLDLFFLCWFPSIID